MIADEDNYTRGIEAFMAGAPSDSNPHCGKGGRNSDFYEWALGWYRTAWELDTMAYKKYGKSYKELSQEDA